MALNWTASSASSDEPGPDLVGRHAPGQVALGQPARRLGQATQGRGEAAGHDRRHEDAEAEREQRDRGQEAGDVGQGRGPERVRIGQLDLERVRREDACRWCTSGRPRRTVSWVWPGTGLAANGKVRGAPFAAWKPVPSPCGTPQPKVSVTSAWAELVGDDPLLVGVQDAIEDTRIDRAVGEDDRIDRPDRLLGPGPDVLVDGLRALVEVRPLLAREVVVEPVDDEDRDEQQGQRHDRHEGAGQATLEGAGEEPAQSTRETSSALVGSISARRMRSRHLGPSGRTPAPPGRPRSCRADG